MSGIRAEDLYPDNVDTHVFQGVELRKGTVSAVVANIELLNSASSSMQEKEEARQMLTEYAPSMVVAGLHRLVKWNNPEVQALMDEAAERFKNTEWKKPIS